MRTAPLAAVICLGLCACVWAEDEYDIKVYPCPRAYVAVVIDGALDEADWDRAPLVTGFTQYNKPELVEPQASLRVMYDDTNLYFGVICDEPRMDKMTPISRARDSSEVFHGEAIEIFVDPKHDHGSYYQFGINAAASIYDSHLTDVSWSADARAATVLGDDFWSLEFAIPWADLGVTPEAGAVIGFNVCRDRQLGTEKLWANWSQTKANFHDPQRFAHAVLSPDAQQLGALEAEYRKGARDGAIVFLGPSALTQAAWRALVRRALVASGATLGEMEKLLDQEAEEGAREEFARRIAGFRADLAGYADSVESGKPLDVDTWKEMTTRMARMRSGLDRLVWEARLTALLSTI